MPEKKIKAIGIIPARGGSKGIPRKNLTLLNGVPLIEYSIRAALASNLSRVFVSTEDEEIAGVAKKLGAEVPFLRKREFAQDHSPISDSILELLHFLETSESYQSDVVVQLQPTSPLRNANHINEALNLFETSNSNYVISLSDPLESPYDMVEVESDHRIHFLLNHDGTPGAVQRQAHRRCLFINGALYLAKTQSFLENKSMFHQRMTPYLMSPLDSIDIDSQEHLFLAEAIIRARGQKKT